MPRDANGAFYYPPGTQAEPFQTANASDVNARFDAVKTDLNEGPVAATRLTGSIADARLPSTVARKGADNNFTAAQTINDAVAIKAAGTAELFFRDGGSVNAALLYGSTADDTFTVRAYATGGAISRNFVFNGLSGNFTIPGTFNGSGAGLSALNATALTTGTVPDARLPSTAVRTSRSVSAGNGLTGGGTLAADRSIALGTPSAITATSTNTVSGSSHTHALPEEAVRQLVAQGAAGAVGTLALLVRDAGNTADITPGSIQPGTVLRYTSAAGSSGFRPGGEWRVLGFIPANAATAPERTTLFVRVT